MNGRIRLLALIGCLTHGGEPMIVPYRATAQPDTTACIFWLKNRRPDRWRDVHKHEHGGRNAFDQMSDEELRQYIAEVTQAVAYEQWRWQRHEALRRILASANSDRWPVIWPMALRDLVNHSAQVNSDGAHVRFEGNILRV